jgi:hypothetical protein
MVLATQQSLVHLSRQASSEARGTTARPAAIDRGDIQLRQKRRFNVFSHEISSASASVRDESSKESGIKLSVICATLPGEQTDRQADRWMNRLQSKLPMDHCSPFCLSKAETQQLLPCKQHCSTTLRACFPEHHSMAPATNQTPPQSEEPPTSSRVDSSTSDRMATFSTRPHRPVHHRLPRKALQRLRTPRDRDRQNLGQESSKSGNFDATNATPSMRIGSPDNTQVECTHAPEPSTTSWINCSPRSEPTIALMRHSTSRLAIRPTLLNCS